MYKSFITILLFVSLSGFIKSQDCTFTIVSITSTTGDWANEMSWRITKENGEEIATFQGETNHQNHQSTVCLENGCYIFEARDSYGDGWNGGFVLLSFDSDTLEFSLTEGTGMNYAFGIHQDGCVVQVPGCTDPESINYDPLATIDDGSCLDFQSLLDVQEWDTIHYSGDKNNRINWVIQNRGVPNPANDIQSLEELSQLYHENLYRTFMLGDDLEIPPYAQYKDFFNLFAVYWPDAPTDEEYWDFNLLHAMRDHFFLPWSNDSTGWITWFSTTKHGGGGGAGLERERRVGSGKMYGMGWETLLHEFGHTMPGLLDEYSSDGSWSNGQCWETPNTTGQSKLDDIPWRLWIKPETPLPTPYTEEYLNSYGAFEGAMTNFFGCHRPSARGCFMGAGGFGEDYGQSLCGPCIQRVICYLYQYVNVIELHEPSNLTLEPSANQTIQFSVDILKPEPNTQKYAWFLNGKKVAEDVQELSLQFETCEYYELRFSVLDTNTLVRYDPKFEHIYPKPQQEITWIINPQITSGDKLDVAEIIGQPDCTGEDNGEISFDIQGGTPPYSIIWNGVEHDQSLTGLAAGEYFFDIVDANLCSESVDIILEQDLILDPDICSSQSGGKWNLWIEDQNYSNEVLDIEWSNGEHGPEILGLVDGDYSVFIRTTEGCEVMRSISLISIQDSLSVDAQTLSTELGKNNGRIDLFIQGGRPDYSIEWKDKPNHDLTSPDIDHIGASGTTWDHLPEYAFDNNTDTKWLHFVSSDAWISYHIPGGAIVTQYTITSGNDVPGRDPKDWLFEGSVDGENWELLDQRMNEEFQSRFQKRTFLLDNEEPYHYYRLYVLANHGDGSIQLQELEFIGTRDSDPFHNNEMSSNQISRTDLTSGQYIYMVKDQNGLLQTDTLIIHAREAYSTTHLVVEKKSDCSVGVQSPEDNFEYYWLSDEEGTEILHTGEIFSPPARGNYYLASVHRETKLMSLNRSGFAVSMPDAPAVSISDEGKILVENPNDDFEYYWYDHQECSDPIQIGPAFSPTENGYYYVSAKKKESLVEEIDPLNVSGLIVRMDASDLDGDGELDNPPPATSSLLDWYFSNGNHWSFGSWFAFRSNHQNGKGVVDFATIWYQSLNEAETNYQTIILAYEENPISFPNTAPFEALSYHIPRHTDDSQLFADNTPETTLSGTTFLNGQMVDPLITANPLEFSVLAVRMTEASTRGISETDTHWEGKIGELLLYDRALSNDEVFGISEHLKKKWISTADLNSPKTEVLYDLISSSTQAEEQNAINIFPNPSTGMIHFRNVSSMDVLKIYSLEGKLIHQIPLHSGMVSIDLKRLVNGLYLIHLTNSRTNKRLVYKIIKTE